MAESVKELPRLKKKYREDIRPALNEQCRSPAWSRSS